MKVRALLAGVIATLLASTATAQPRDQKERPPIAPAGTEMFKLLMHLAKLEPVNTHDLDFNRFKDHHLVVVVILGSPNPNDLRWARYVASRGGAVLIASDASNFYVWDPEEYYRLNGSGVGFNGSRVHAPFDAPVHRDLEACPYIVPVSPDPMRLNGSKPGPIWSVFGGLDRIAANQGTFLYPRYGDAFQFPLAEYPKNSYLAQTGNPLPRGAVFAVGGEGDARTSPYRVIAMGDQSVFINGMLADEELHNFTLATRTVEYLKDPGGVNRRYCLFIEDGRTAQRFDDLAYALRDPPPPLPPLPPISQFQEKLVDLGNHMVDQLQTNDFANKMILGGTDPERQNRQLRKLIGILLLIATSYMLFQLLKRMWTTRQPQDVPLPPLTGRPSKPDAANPAGIFDRRQRELFRRDNMLELVRGSLREMFTRAGATEPADAKLPQVVIADEVHRPETLHKALSDLWKLAHGKPKRLSVKQWAELEPLFVRANRAFDDGKWRFAS